MGKAHSHAWRNVRAFFPDAPRVRQQVLVGRDPGQVKVAAARLRLDRRRPPTGATVLERDDVDIIDICVPGHLHAEIALAALAAGKHVLVEKPLANTVAEAETLVTAAAAARRRGRRLDGRLQLPPSAGPRAGPRLIAEGRLGEVRQVRAAYLQDWLADARGTDDVAAAPGHRRFRCPGRPGLARRRPGALPARRPVPRPSRATCTPSCPSAAAPTGVEQVTVDDAAWATLEHRDRRASPASR